MNYDQLYKKLIEKVRTRPPLDCYQEWHHVISRHSGGLNDLGNLVLLTYREHILAHLLLWKRDDDEFDKCAYRLMRGLSKDRKREISIAIGNRHVKSGHIQALGRRNVETGHMKRIRSKESCRKGGLRSGAIARERGQIQSIGTPESSRKGGQTAGALARERGQIQQLGKYKGTYMLIMPDGTEFHHAFQAAESTGLTRDTLTSRCKARLLGFSQRKKTKAELLVKDVAIRYVPQSLVEIWACPFVRTGKYVYSTPDGSEHHDGPLLAEQLEISYLALQKRSMRMAKGFSRREKTSEEREVYKYSLRADGTKRRVKR